MLNGIECYYIQMNRYSLEIKITLTVYLVVTIVQHPELQENSLEILEQRTHVEGDTHISADEHKSMDSLLIHEETAGVDTTAGGVAMITVGGVSSCTGETRSSVLSRFSGRVGEPEAASDSDSSLTRLVIFSFPGATGDEAGNLKGGAKRREVGSGRLESSFWLSASKSGSVSTACVYFAILVYRIRVADIV